MSAGTHTWEQAINQTRLDIKLAEYQWPRVPLGVHGEWTIDDVEMLRLLTLEIRSILLRMDPAVKFSDNVSDLKNLILAHQ